MIRPVPEGYLGLADSPKYRVAAIEPNRFLVLDGFVTFVLAPIDTQATRVIVRGNSASALAAMEPINFIMGRRLLLGIKERAEGALRASAMDSVEMLTWLVAFAVVVVGGVRVLVRPQWVVQFVVLLGAIISLLILLFARPPLGVGVLLNVMWTFALARWLAGSGVVANSADPGGAWTAMTQAMAPRSMPGWVRPFWPVLRWLQRRGSAEQAAHSSIFLASAPSAATMTGTYLGSKLRPASPAPAALDRANQEQAWALAVTLVANAPTATHAYKISADRTPAAAAVAVL